MRNLKFFAVAGQYIPRLLVDLDIGSPEAVDRLLGIAHKKKFTRRRVRLLPGSGAGLLFSEQKKQIYL